MSKRPDPELNGLAALFATAASMPGVSNRGYASLDDMAECARTTRREVLVALAELLAEGCMRAGFGPLQGVPALGRLLLTDGDGDEQDVITALILDPASWEPLSDDRKQHLKAYLNAVEDLTLGGVVLIQGSLRVANENHSFTSDEIEEYLDAPPGSMR